jgi:hypothetical protein
LFGGFETVERRKKVAWNEQENEESSTYSEPVVEEDSNPSRERNWHGVGEADGFGRRY